MESSTWCSGILRLTRFLFCHFPCRSVGSTAYDWGETTPTGCPHFHQNWPPQSTGVWRSPWDIKQRHICAWPGDMGIEIYISYLICLCMCMLQCVASIVLTVYVLPGLCSSNHLLYVHNNEGSLPLNLYQEPIYTHACHSWCGCPWNALRWELWLISLMPNVILNI